MDLRQLICFSDTRVGLVGEHVPKEPLLVHNAIVYGADEVRVVEDGELRDRY